MSWQRWALNAYFRYGMKPVLGLVRSPALARWCFEHLAPVFCPPLPHTVLLRRSSAPVPMTFVSCGRTRRREVILYLHGGAYLAGSARSYTGLLSRLSRAAETVVAAPDYRVLPEAPFPAAFEDALAAWQYLRDRGYPPERILLAGDSAGGGLALALLSALLRRGEKPGAAAVFSPWCDLTLSGASVRRNRARDAVIPAARMQEVIALYLGGADPFDPRASPLFARYPGPPPVLIQAGDTEVLLSDAERMAARLRQAGGKVKLSLWRDVPHVWQFMAGKLPEGRAALTEAGAFLRAPPGTPKPR
ncbi:alpha/beta hydrolase [Cribrihabitans neustonicus]|uniref:alpha/beta hydrolase n=1 Tax=Cribrihabitans neustonicus TaxID=1429085 RepID=UPI003B5978A2